MNSKEAAKALRQRIEGLKKECQELEKLADALEQQDMQSQNVTEILSGKEIERLLSKGRRANAEDLRRKIDEDNRRKSEGQ